LSGCNNPGGFAAVAVGDLGVSFMEVMPVAAAIHMTENTGSLGRTPGSLRNP